MHSHNNVQPCAAPIPCLELIGFSILEASLMTRDDFQGPRFADRSYERQFDFLLAINCKIVLFLQVFSTSLHFEQPQFSTQFVFNRTQRLFAVKVKLSGKFLKLFTQYTPVKRCFELESSKVRLKVRAWQLIALFCSVYPDQVISST